MVEPNNHPSTRPPSAPVELEALLGGRVLQAVGLVSLFLSAAFFFKLAIDHGWIPPAGRVGIGLLAGIAFLLAGIVAHRRPAGNRAIVEGFIALGGALCYLSIWAAGPLFSLVTPLIAFGGMIAVTCALAALAARHTSQITALYGLIGGLLTPALLPHQDQQGILAAYVLVLSIGMLILAHKKQFALLPNVAFITTMPYAWQFISSGDHWTYVDATLAATALFLVFAYSQFVTMRAKATLDIFDIAFLITNTISYIGILELTLQAHQQLLSGMLVALCALAVWASTKAREDRLLELSSMFVAMAALACAVLATFHEHPWLDGAGIAGVGALAYGLGAFRAQRSVRMTGLLVTATATAFEIMQMLFIEPALVSTIERVAVYAALAGALFLIGAIAHDGPNDRIRFRSIGLAGLAVSAANALVVIGIANVAFTLAPDALLSASQQQFLTSGAWTLVAAIVFAVALRRRSRFMRWQSLAIFGLTVCKVLCVDLASMELIDRVGVSLALGIATLAVSAVYLRRAEQPQAPLPDA